MLVTAVVGMHQYGKTTLALKLLADRPRLLVLDPKRTKALRSVPGESSWGALRQRLATEDGPWRVALRSQSEADYAEALAAVERLRYATLLVDEALWFMDDPEAGRRLVHVARTNAHFGGGIGVPLWLTAQRPMDVPPDIRSQVDCWISFYQDEPADLDYLRKKCGRRFAETLPTLPKYAWRVWPEGELADVESEELQRAHRRGGARRGPLRA